VLSLGSVAAAVQPRPAEPEPRPRHLWIVPPRHRAPAAQRRRTRLALAAAAIGFALVVFGLVYLHVISTEKQFTIDRLTATQTQLEQQYQVKRLRVDRAYSPAHVMKAALRDGMVEPSSVQAIKAPVGSATPASANTTPANGEQAPAGASDWPQVKPNLVGSP
jgi:hypothetical protein